MRFALPINDAAGDLLRDPRPDPGSPCPFERLRIPILVGLIAAGVLVGPSGLGIMEPGAIRDLLGEMGLVYTFFLFGVDADSARMKRTRGVHLGYGVLLSVLPFGLCAGLAILVLHADPAVAVFLGLVIASQSLLPAPALQRLGLGKSRALLAAEGGDHGHRDAQDSLPRGGRLCLPVRDCPSRHGRRRSGHRSGMAPGPRPPRGGQPRPGLCPALAGRAFLQAGQGQRHGRIRLCPRPRLLLRLGRKRRRARALCPGLCRGHTPWPFLSRALQPRTPSPLHGRLALHALLPHSPRHGP